MLLVGVGIDGAFETVSQSSDVTKECVDHSMLPRRQQLSTGS